MARKVFSSSFTISAVCVEETGTMRSKTPWKTSAASSVHSGVSPPTTFGTSRTWKRWFAGSMRSGAKASAKSTPQRRPVDSSIGTKSSCAVPGIGGAAEDHELARAQPLADLLERAPPCARRRGPWPW